MLAAAHDVYRTFAVVGAPDPARELCKQWQGVNAKCKDVVVLALPLKDLPVSKEAFADAAGGEFIRAQFYVVRVGPVDGQDWGWSNAPYDCAKKTPRSDLRGLYSVDESGDTKGETRFHAFKKVSNNKNKGARVEAPIEGVDTSFVLPQGSVITFFMREDAYEGSKVFVNAGDTAVVPAFTPLVLQLSGTNCEQALKGNGLKLRRIMHLRTECLTPFMADLCTSKHEALQRQELGRRYPAIANVVSRSTTPPVVCTVLPDAFVFQNEDLERRGMVELVDSGLDMDVAPVLLLPVDLMLAVLHTQDFQRAKRLFCVALGHGAVKCVVVPSEQGEAVVRHLHVDAQRMLWLDTLQQMRSSDRPAELPNNDMLVMCFGRRIGVDGSGVGFGSESPHDVLQVCAPGVAVARAPAPLTRVSAVVQPVQDGHARGCRRPRRRVLLRLRGGPGHEALARRRGDSGQVLPDGRGRRAASQPARVQGGARELHPRGRARHERRRQPLPDLAAPAVAEQQRHARARQPHEPQAAVLRARRDRPHQLAPVVECAFRRLYAALVLIKHFLSQALLVTSTYKHARHNPRPGTAPVAGILRARAARASQRSGTRLGWVPATSRLHSAGTRCSPIGCQKS